MGDQISGMYPTLIIVIVNFHKTVWELKHPNGITKTAGLGGTLRFVSNVKISNTDTTGTFTSTTPGHMDDREDDRDLEIGNTPTSSGGLGDSFESEVKKYNIAGPHERS
jgi:hypothetical protein